MGVKGVSDGSGAATYYDDETATGQGDPLEVHGQIAKSLSRSITDPVISDRDVSNVTKSLGTLSPADYKKELERMDKAGLLDKYVGNMTPEARKQFLDQAVQKGYLKKEEGEKALTKTLNPPSSPALYENSGKLPKGLQQAVHDQNVDAAKKYGEDYDKYIKRYSDAVKNAPDIDTIHKLGRPADPITFREPGVLVNHPDYRRLSSDWNRNTPNSSAFGGYKAISDRCYSLTGTQRPGSFWFTAEGTAKAGDLSVKGGVKLSSDGLHKGSLEASGKVGDKSGSIKIEKEAGKEWKADSKIAAESTLPKSRFKAQVEIEKDKFKVGTENKKGTGAKISSNGELEVSHGGAYGKVSPKEATFEGGVKVKLGEKAEVKVGVGQKTITAKEVKHNLYSKGFFQLQNPPELKQHIPWDKLPEEKRDMYRINGGWTKESWDRKLR